MLRKFDNHGFTIAELLAIIGAIALLMIIFFLLSAAILRRAERMLISPMPGRYRQY